LKQFLPLTQNPALYYPELVKTGTVGLLASLLSHENTDIAIDVVQVVQELTDEDVGAEDENLSDMEDEDRASATRIALAQFIDELVSHLWLFLSNGLSSCTPSLSCWSPI
jgi:beta-catenin-like protein 1